VALVFIKQLKRSSRANISRVCVCRCDECGVFFESSFKARNKNIHFCSRSCYRLGQQKKKVLSEQIRQTNIKRRGVDYPTQCVDVIAKQNKTKKEKFGLLSHELMQLRFKEATGLSNASQLPEHKDKVKATSISRYGVEHPFQSDVIKSKIRETCIIRFGVSHYAQSAEYNIRARATCQSVYGVDWPMQSSFIKNQIDWSAAVEKRHATMKKNGSFGRSKTEDSFFDVLSSIFENVERQVVINGWAVDFYVPSIDTFVQFDGIYWHGYDKTVDELQVSNNRRDAVILGTKLRDAKQCMWFKQMGKKLVRLTDKEWKKAVKSGNEKQLVVRLFSDKMTEI
jgi:very-short-patch-repair endonuclease